MIWGKGHKPLAHWWFAWHPVQLTNSGRWLWLEKVYRELHEHDGATKYYMGDTYLAIRIKGDDND